jgi:hypothetical protein
MEILFEGSDFCVVRPLQPPPLLPIEYEGGAVFLVAKDGVTAVQVIQGSGI